MSIPSSLQVRIKLWNEGKGGYEEINAEDQRFSGILQTIRQNGALTQYLRENKASVELTDVKFSIKKTGIEEELSPPQEVNTFLKNALESVKRVNLPEEGKGKEEKEEGSIKIEISAPSQHETLQPSQYAALEASLRKADTEIKPRELLLYLTRKDVITDAWVSLLKKHGNMSVVQARDLLLALIEYSDKVGELTGIQFQMDNEKRPIEKRILREKLIRTGKHYQRRLMDLNTLLTKESDRVTQLTEVVKEFTKFNPEKGEFSLKGGFDSQKEIVKNFYLDNNFFIPWEKGIAKKSLTLSDDKDKKSKVQSAFEALGWEPQMIAKFGANSLRALHDAYRPILEAKQQETYNETKDKQITVIKELFSNYKDIDQDKLLSVAEAVFEYIDDIETKSNTQRTLKALGWGREKITKFSNWYDALHKAYHPLLLAKQRLALDPENILYQQAFKETYDKQIKVIRKLFAEYKNVDPNNLLKVVEVVFDKFNKKLGFVQKIEQIRDEINQKVLPMSWQKGHLFPLIDSKSPLGKALRLKLNKTQLDEIHKLKNLFDKIQQGMKKLHIIERQLERATSSSHEKIISAFVREWNLCKLKLDPLIQEAKNNLQHIRSWDSEIKSIVQNNTLLKAQYDQINLKRAFEEKINFFEEVKAGF